MLPTAPPGSSAPPPWWRQRRTLLLAVFFLLTLAVAAVETVRTLRAYARAEADALARQTDVAVALAAATRLFVARYEGAVSFAALTLADRQGSAAAARARVLADLRRAYPEAGAILVLDRTGRVTAGGAAYLGRDYSARSAFRRLLAGAPVAVSNLIRGEVSGMPLVVLAAAVRGRGGVFDGAVVMGLPVADLGLGLGLRMSEGAVPVLFDRTGRVIVHGRYREMAWEERDRSHQPFVVRAIETRTIWSGRYRATADGKAMIGTLVPVPGIDWSVGVSQPVDLAFAPARHELRQSLTTILVLLGLGGLFAIVLGGWLSRPFATLVAGVDAIARGDLGHRVQVARRDELGWLAEHVNLMAARLQANEEALRASEEQLRQAQKMEAIGRLAGGIAHDFNNILTAIGGSAEMLARCADPGQVSDYAAGISRAADRAARLTRQLLAFSRRQVLEPRVLDLNAVVSGMEAMLRSLIREDVALVTRVTPGLLAVRADQTQVEQVLLNLAVNARDAMPQGGTLTIETANVTLDQTEAERHPGASAGRYAKLAVTDTGVGMDADTLAKAFEPFFTTKPQGQGTGLGLATVYGIVEQSGGYVRVDSKPARGTTVEVYLPQVDEAAGPIRLPVGGRLPRGSETVLLVEDEDMVRALVRRVLEANGYTVLEAASPEDALALAARHPRKIELLLTDVVMPGGGGPKLAGALAAVRPGVRTLYMSGYTDAAAVRNGVLDGRLVFLQKPFTAETLARKVREALR